MSYNTDYVEILREYKRFVGILKQNIDAKDLFIQALINDNARLKKVKGITEMNDVNKIVKAYRKIGEDLETLAAAVSEADTTDMTAKGAAFVYAMGIAAHTMTKQYNIYADIVGEADGE